MVLLSPSRLAKVSADYHPLTPPTFRMTENYYCMENDFVYELSRCDVFCYFLLGGLQIKKRKRKATLLNMCSE